jgi:hypothetical protein
LKVSVNVVFLDFDLALYRITGEINIYPVEIKINLK